MNQSHVVSRVDIQPQVGRMIDAVLYHGIDPLAARRAHMRELTAARQAAEQRQTRTLQSVRLGEQVPPDTARERTVVLHQELASLNAAHEVWQRAQGEDIEDRHKRKRRKLAVA